MPDIWKLFRRNATAVAEETPAAAVEPCGVFQDILARNNRALELIAEIEEALVTKDNPDPGRLAGAIGELARDVVCMVDGLNALSKEKFPQLPSIVAGIDERIRCALEARLNPRSEESGGPPALPDLLHHISPLHLVDPEDPDFKPESCRTLHDVTHFSHEKAIYFFVKVTSGLHVQAKRTVDLVAGIPILAQISDMGGGLKPDLKKATPEDILSVPFRPLLKGMISMKWPDPPPVDARGFLGMMAHAATVPDEQIRRMGERSFGVVSRNYTNFAIRLGYHFSMVDSYAGESVSENYIRFFFKGGGAALDRRLRRIRLVAEILRRMGFRVFQKDDLIDSILARRALEDLEARLEAIGKLTAYTKQLDMVLLNEPVTDMYIEQFVNQHLRFTRTGGS
ncbi:MAG: hypothetical protein AB1714_14320 [Acidobacteriota bacterium]